MGRGSNGNTDTGSQMLVLDTYASTNYQFLKREEGI